MDEKTVDISVITPFYRGNPFMEQLFGCIRRNACAAEGISIELILVNDSPDCDICYKEEWVDGFRLKICANSSNVGIQKSRINGLNQACGTYVIFLDQDDLLADTALLSQYRAVQDADIVVCNGYNENRDKNRPIFYSKAHQDQVAFPRFYLSVGCLIVSPGQCMIRRAIIPQLWKQTLIDCNGADDYFLWLLLHGESYRWKSNPEILYTHVDTGENLSDNLDRMLCSSTQVLDILVREGKITNKQEALAKRRFRMRRIYEGRSRWRIILACLMYPDLFLELLQYTYLKKFCL